MPPAASLGLLRAPGAGGSAVRLMLPATIIVPVLAALATFIPESLNAISGGVAESLFVLVALVIPAALILVAAARLEAVDRERAAARRGELESERERETVRGEAERAAAERAAAEREAERARTLQAASEELARAVTGAEVLGATVEHALRSLEREQRVRRPAARGSGGDRDLHPGDR